MVVAGGTPALWLVDKPAGPTSHTVVAGMRRALGRRVKVGHAGTLDPFATGLLVVFSGRATRLMADVVGLDKRYRATVRTGFSSATGDPEGPIEPVGPPADEATVQAALAQMVGPQLQQVPDYSAVRVDGERLYAKARRGEQIDAPSRRIVLHSLELVGTPEPGCFEVDIHCSSGTYIRQFASDLGVQVGSGGGYCTALRRTAVGHLGVDLARPPHRLDLAAPRDPSVALAHLPQREVTPSDARELVHGRPLEVGADVTGRVVVLSGGRMVAVAEGDGAGLMRPRVVLWTAEELG